MGVYMRQDIQFPIESIVYKMVADSSGKLYVPTGGVGTGGSFNASYNWDVSIDYGEATNITGTSTPGGSGVSFSGYDAGSEHTIMITPKTEEYGWARAYAWYQISSAPNLTSVEYDGSYMGYAISETHTGDYFRENQYNGCTNLENPPEEVLPNTVTTIGAYFRRGWLRNCTSLTTPAEEVIPNSVTSIGNYFRAYQYAQDTALTYAPEEKMSSNISGTPNYYRYCQFQVCKNITEIKGWLNVSVGNSYLRYRQFYNCTSNKTVKVLNAPGSAYDNNTLQNSYVTAIYVPNEYLNEYISTGYYPRNGITDSKFVGY